MKDRIDRKSAFLLLGTLGSLGSGFYFLTSDDKLPTWKPGAVPKLSVFQIARLAYNAGWRGEDLPIAIAVALAESGGYPDAQAYNRMKDGRINNDRGLWQISSLFHPSFSDAQALDPATNAAYAKRLQDRSGWRAWMTYQDGYHTRFMERARAAASTVNPGGIS